MCTAWYDLTGMVPGQRARVARVALLNNDCARVAHVALLRRGNAPGRIRLGRARGQELISKNSSWGSVR